VTPKHSQVGVKKTVVALFVRFCVFEPSSPLTTDEVQSPNEDGKTRGSLATGSDGKLWFVEFNSAGPSGIGRVNSDGSNVVFFPTPETPVVPQP
jgi:hypothetical protein